MRSGRCSASPPLECRLLAEDEILDPFPAERVVEESGWELTDRDRDLAALLWPE